MTSVPMRSQDTHCAAWIQPLFQISANFLKAWPQQWKSWANSGPSLILEAVVPLAQPCASGKSRKEPDPTGDPGDTWGDGTVLKRLIPQYIWQALKYQHASKGSRKDNRKIWILLEVEMLGYGEQWVPQAVLPPLCVCNWIKHRTWFYIAAPHSFWRAGRGSIAVRTAGSLGRIWFCSGASYSLGLC